MTTQVRTATPADLPVLDRELPSGRNDVHAEFLARQAAGDATYLVAWGGPVPVGTGLVRWHRDGRDPEISNLQVPERLRGRGIGTALIRYAEQVVRIGGRTRVTIGVDEQNTRAAALYDRLGYLDTGVRWTGSYQYYDDAGVQREATEHVRLLAKTV